MIVRHDDVEIVVDNDVIKKSVCYGIALTLWSDEQFEHGIGTLGAAQYVVRGTIHRHTELVRAKNEILADLNAFLARTTKIEPNEAEVGFAADIERAAQEHGVAVDAG